MDVDTDLQVGRWVLPAHTLQWRFSRSSGPGGQGVNTTDSRVELSVDVAGCAALPAWLRERAVRRLGNRLAAGVLTVTAREERSQLRNRAAARSRMVALLTEAFAPPEPPRRATRPSRRAVERRLSSKRTRGETKRLRGRPKAE
ncbi:MAG TPA: alternative ribosome rescue aminoacyl-tRNA hydrolase ArfB [Mycobacteriales bacterium]|nr:alternative ribosome rescue aminoacyl-tRNA hydrolase ArfB [Mycobacteriales bacterium]